MGSHIDCDGERLRSPFIVRDTLPAVLPPVPNGGLDVMYDFQEPPYDYDRDWEFQSERIRTRREQEEELEFLYVAARLDVEEGVDRNANRNLQREAEEEYQLYMEAIVKQSIQTLNFNQIPVRLDAPTSFEPLVFLTVALAEV
ncbi:hypothetical protein MBANPS3_010422, partial [Mucor bainieri]